MERMTVTQMLFVLKNLELEEVTVANANQAGMETAKHADVSIW